MSEPRDDAGMTADEYEAYHNEMMAQYHHEVTSRLEYEESQAALPPHKRDGWLEKAQEQADMLRKAKREQ